MDENGFAFKSGKFHYNDRILGCNGVDFTRKDHSEPVKDIFNRMAQEPVLKIAIGRGVGIPIATDNGGTEEINENGTFCDVWAVCNFCAYIEHSNRACAVPNLLAQPWDTIITNY